MKKFLIMSLILFNFGCNQSEKLDATQPTANQDLFVASNALGKLTVISQGEKLKDILKKLALIESFKVQTNLALDKPIYVHLANLTLEQILSQLLKNFHYSIQVSHSEGGSNRILRIAGNSNINSSFPFQPDEIRYQRKIKILETLQNLDSEITINTLIDFSHDDELPVRLAAIEMLTSIDHPKAKDRLLECLNDNNPLIKRLALSSLEDSHSINDIIAIEQLLHSSDQETRLSAIQALSAIGNSRSIAILVQQLNHNTEAIRFEALQALLEMPFHLVKQYLVPLTNDESPRIKKLVSQALDENKLMQAIDQL